ncbi:MAG: hypothetical protein QOI06_2032 [Nocardioidaceae bacterium]|jgi:hypothetical protein|nr:hypothetical protein [Nocardioidaceae bacterium]
MSLFHRKTTLERLVEPVSNLNPKSAAKSGLMSVGALVGMSLLSSAVTALRQRNQNT